MVLFNSQNRKKTFVSRTISRFRNVKKKLLIKVRTIVLHAYDIISRKEKTSSKVKFKFQIITSH